MPTTVPQVQGAVSCGVQFGYKINAKGGGHSYASHSLGAENGHLVIELDRMYNVTLNSTTKIAVVQAGARLGHVLTQLDSQGKRAFSTGTCPGVGVSGHALHGGYGFSSRKYGLATDWIIGAQIVLANGTLIHTSAAEHPEVFWAIRGAGSNFGVVVSYEFNTFAQPSQVTYFTVTANWNANNMQANMLALENYTRYSMPAELTMRYTINPGGQNEFEGMYYGNKTGLQTALAPLFNSVSPKLSLGSSTTTTFMAAFDYYAYTPATDPTYPYNTVSAPILHPTIATYTDQAPARKLLRQKPHSNPPKRQRSPSLRLLHLPTRPHQHPPMVAATRPPRRRQLRRHKRRFLDVLVRASR